MKKLEQEHIIDTGDFTIEDNILLYRFPEVKTVTLEMVKKAVEDRLTLSNGKTYPLLTDIRAIRGATRSAMQYASKEGSQGVAAVSILVGSPVTNMVGKIYLAFEKPKIPTQVFKNKDKAIKWLKEKTVYLRQPTDPVYENDYMVIYLENEIIKCYFKPIKELTLEIAQECLKARIQIANNKVYSLLVDVSLIRSSTAEARRFLGNEGSRQIKAGALIVSSPVSSMMANLFIILQRPKVPTKMFNNEENAIKWLDYQKEKEL